MKTSLRSGSSCLSLTPVTSTRLKLPAAIALGSLLALSLSGCGGGGGESTMLAGGASSSVNAGSTINAVNDAGTGVGAGSAQPASSNASPAAAAQPAAVAPVAAVPATTLAALSVPVNVANDSTVLLECGRGYEGTLNLAGKSNVTVKTNGSCGMATLTAGQNVTGWRQESGNVYSAAVSFAPDQVIVDGSPVSLAHWPNSAAALATPTGTSASTIRANLPNGDLVGANVVYRSTNWSYDSRPITGYASGTMTVGARPSDSFDGYDPSGTGSFYVEGKLWMLDTAGEWAYSNGRLYLWAPDGQSPEGRVYASAAKHAIEASNSSGITIDGVKIYGVATAVNAPGATRLSMLNSQVVNASDNGIANAGGSGLTVNATLFQNIRHDAIGINWGGGGESIQNSRFENIGTVGMPTNSRAAVNITDGVGSKVINNTVVNAGYNALWVFRGATVANNTVDGACRVLSDCGGIYMMGRDQQPLNTVVSNNVVKNVGQGQQWAWAIYLDDSSNSVTVSGNTITDNAAGMQIHNGFNNVISGNTFARNAQNHIFMNENPGYAIRGIQVTGNSFSMATGQAYQLGADGNNPATAFGSYSKNSYVSSVASFADLGWGNSVTWAQWRSQTGQDGDSTFRAQ
ncbi:parallel beta-helix repeat (two copies) [Noviherbaspirillum humi]|uniref:Parallel beta-helix repeat (Two copies) n=1 Tax=Noviherbaspirillum humi TaxID=1688639 RepID=A0A239F0P4_9BURK|nr:right-handed parallel beta-helix repeat-containing protein [Noviherbaspirillum humi]SNS50271.1 parallel beta-helix repeat (two copies) [Noviherbaspirillum humi]